MRAQQRIRAATEPTFPALRRSLWQLAAAGVAAAWMLGQLAPDAPALARWCVLLPACALLVHGRHGLRRQALQLARAAAAMVPLAGRSRRPARLGGCAHFHVPRK
ncbi:MAG: hypothetical protein JSS45_08260 [Proteobacteria bacterium]|nr:hypothetical protein [Pseudomonadota bacterium]